MYTTFGYVESEACVQLDKTIIDEYERVRAENKGLSYLVDKDWEEAQRLEDKVGGTTKTP